MSKPGSQVPSEAAEAKAASKPGSKAASVADFSQESIAQMMDHASKPKEAEEPSVPVEASAPQDVSAVAQLGSQGSTKKRNYSEISGGPSEQGYSASKRRKLDEGKESKKPD